VIQASLDDEGEDEPAASDEPQEDESAREGGG
jgi:hypothetical protein